MLLTIKKPAVNRKWLLALSGFIWSGVGILLNSFAFQWLSFYEGAPVMVALATLAGVLLGLGIAFFGFRNIAEANIQRILRMPVRSCIFAFQKWHSYTLVVVMMSMGLFLRNSSILPLLVLATMYMGIGAALFISSISYYRALLDKNSPAEQLMRRSQGGRIE